MEFFKEKLIINSNQFNQYCVVLSSEVAYIKNRGDDVKLKKMRVIIYVLVCLLSVQMGTVLALEIMNEDEVNVAVGEETVDDVKRFEKPVIYNLELLTKRLIAESLEVEKIELRQERLLLSLEQTLEDYEDLQDDVENAKKLVEAREQQVEAAKNELSRSSTGTPERMQAEAVLRWNIELLDAAERSYEAMVKQEASMMESLELMKLQRDQSNRNKEQAIKDMESNLEKNYYQLLLLESQKELLEKQLENMDNNLESEKVKKDLELTTQMSIFELEKDRSSLFFNIRNVDNNIQQVREKIKTDINMGFDEELLITLEFEGNNAPRQFALSDVIKGFNKNNLSLETIRRTTEIKNKVYDKIKIAYDEEDNEYKIALIEIREAEINEKISVRNFEHLVKQAYFQHEQAKIELVLQLQEKILIEEKLKHTRVQYKLGLISELQYQASLFQLEQAEFNYISAKVNYINARITVDLLMKGIN